VRGECEAKGGREFEEADELAENVIVKVGERSTCESSEINHP